MGKLPTDLLKKDDFKWLLDATTTFEQLQISLTKAHVLVLPDASKIFVLKTDAINFGIGVVLMQQGHSIAFMSKASLL